MTTIKRRVEITFFERERVVRRAATAHCRVCRAEGEMLTPEQAGDVAGVGPESIRRWLAEGLAHGLRTAGGEERVCKNSLFRDYEAEASDLPAPPDSV